jgi:flagellar biosynthesis GTPase FlhF
MMASLLLASDICVAQQDRLTACFQNLASRPQFSSISAKLDIGTAARSSPAMLSDNSIAKDNERRAIADWAAARAECLQAAHQEGTALYRPPLLAYGIEAENKVLAAAVDLYDRKISFGEFNRRRQVISEEQHSKAGALSRQIQEQRAAHEQADRHARDTEELRRELQEVERQAALAQQQALAAQQAQETAARGAAARAANRQTVQPPVFRGTRPYSDCFRFGGRIVCTPR